MSADHFEVGEVAIFHCPGSSFHGCELTILEPLQFVGTGGFKCETGRPVAPCYAYWTDLQGRQAWCEPQHMRKKRPPRNDLKVVRWSDVPWQPAKADA